MIHGDNDATDETTDGLPTRSDPAETVHGSDDSSTDFSHATAMARDARLSINQARTQSVVRAEPKINGYEILGEISRGGMGVVYRARQLSANRLVALKMILGGAAASEQQIARFFIEAEAAANLDHPGIVPIFDVGTQDGLPYYSMGLVDGQSLKEHLDDGVLPSRSAAKLVLQIAQAIDYAHVQGTIHRDLKPANILIKQRSLGTHGSGEVNADSGSGLASGSARSTGSSINWFPVVTDFGLAKQISEDSGLTGTDQMLGTPSYMAPEQAIGNVKAIDCRSDIYAMGTILYESLTGRPPFVGANWRDVVHQLENAEPVQPSSLNRSVDRDLETICLKCLEKEPSRRYQSSAELAAELQRYLNHEPIHARPLGRFGRLARWSRRNPMVAMLTGCTATAMLLGTAVSLYWASVAEVRARDAARAEAVASAAASEANLQRLEATAQRVEATSQRDQAQQQLYQSLVNESRFLRLAKLQGWRPLSMESLARAGDLAAADGNVANLRGELLTTLSQMDCRDVPVINPPHQFTVRSLQFSPDGGLLASHGFDGSRAIWNVTDEGLKYESSYTELPPQDFTRRMYSPFAPMPAAQWLDDNQTLISSDWSGGIRSDGLTHVSLSDQRINVFVKGLDRSQVGDRLAVGWSDGLASVHDLHSGVAIHKVQATTTTTWNPVAISPNGRWLATLGDSTNVKLHDLSRPDDPASIIIVHADDVRSLQFSQDGKWLVSGSMDNTARLYLIEQRRELAPLIGHSGRVNDVAISSGAEWIATASDDETVRLWDARTSREQIVLSPKIGPVTSVAFSPDGQHLACAFSQLKCYRIEELPFRQTYQGHDYSTTDAVFHPQCPLLITTSGTQQYGFWQTSEKPRWQISLGTALDERPAHSNNSPRGTQISPDGRWLVAASNSFTNGPKDDHSLSLWDLHSDADQPRLLKGHTIDVTSIGFSPTSKHLVSLDRNGGSYVWQTETGSRSDKLTGSTNPLTKVVFLDETTYLQVFANGKVVRRRINDSKVITSRTWTEFSPSAMAYAPTTGVLVVADSDGIVRQIDVASLDPIRTIVPTPSGVIRELTFSHSGKLLVIGHSDGGWTMWDATSWSEIIDVGHRQRHGLAAALQSIQSISFSPNDRYLALCRDTEEFEVWDLHLAFDSLAHTGLDANRLARLFSRKTWPTLPLPKLVRGRPQSTVDLSSSSAVEHSLAGIHAAIGEPESAESIYKLAHGLDRLVQVRERRSEHGWLLRDLTDLSENASKSAVKTVLEAYLATARYAAGNQQQAIAMFQAMSFPADQSETEYFASLIAKDQHARNHQLNELHAGVINDMLAYASECRDEWTLRWLTQRTPPAIYTLYNHDSHAGALASDQWKLAFASVAAENINSTLEEIATSASQQYLPPLSLGRHAELIGTLKLPLEAEALDDEPFDWQIAKNKVVLIDVWAPWCAPCMRVNPRIKEWTEKFGADNFVAISLSKYDGYDWDDEKNTGSINRELSEPEQRESIQRFAAHHEMLHPLGMISKQTFLDLGVQYIPQLMVFDHTGKLRHIGVGAGEATFDSIEEVLSEYCIEEPEHKSD